MKPHVPNPCHEDWSQMLPEEQGRFCGVCSKMVIDFTDWEPEAISDYLMQRKEEKVCGRFGVHQLHTPVKPRELNWPALIGVSALSYLRKVAAVIVVVFGLSSSSCNTRSQGQVEAAPEMPDTVQHAQSNIVDDDSVLMGKPIPPARAECDKGLHISKPVVISRATEVMGGAVGVTIGNLNDKDTSLPKISDTTVLADKLEDD